MGSSRAHRLSQLGQSVWIDTLSRDLIHGGELERLIREDAVVGATSNPTIFQKALSAGNAYDEQIGQLLEHESDPKEIFVALAACDVGDACDLFRPVWEGTGGRDGYVSIEVDPALAYDAEATVEEASRLHALIDRPNLLVKIPGTRPGLWAIEDMIARGKSINVTLIFSLERHAAVMESYLRGLERLVAAGGDPSRVSSVASFFVSRVDTETDRRLDAVGGNEDLKSKLGIANAKLAYAQYLEEFAGERWDFLASKGARMQRCLWASTSTKDPALSDVLYVEKLLGPDTVNTVPEETLRAFQDHGKVEPTLARGLDKAQKLLEKLAEAGVDYDDVTETLEREGVEKFASSFEELLAGIRARQVELAAV